MTKTILTRVRSTLRMADPRLPLTVSRAAIELDKASKGDEEVDFQATRQLTQFLHESLEQDLETGSGHLVGLDASTVDVMGPALMESEGGENVRTVGDVVEHARKLVLEMEKISQAGQQPPETQQPDYSHLRRFCVAFGNSLLATRDSRRDDGPVHPYRR